MSDTNQKTYALLLAGGSGTRLWPISRELFPKQLTSLCGEHSLLQITVKRLLSPIEKENILIVSGESQYFNIKKHLEEIGIGGSGNIISEPCGRNTAPAILLGVLEILKHNDDAIIFVFPADHIISDQKEFENSLRAATQLANKDYIVTFGIKPYHPETGYGYIEAGSKIDENGFSIKRFTEKPDIEKAIEFLEIGSYYWNSGMFCFKASTIIEEFESYHPKILSELNKLVSKNKKISTKEYENLPSISIDYAIMEKTSKGAVLPSDFGWSDIGSWKSLFDFVPKNSENNFINGDVILNKTKNSFIKSNGRLIAVNCLEGIAVIDTPDATLVTSLNKSIEIKSIVNKLKEENRKEYNIHTTDYRPWGYYTVIEESDNSKVKRIVVYPGAKLSLQKHHHRSEHWVVVKGTAKVVNGDQTTILKENESIFVPKGNKHRMENPGDENLHIIEVQYGDYLGEDDIVRIEDDFGRAG